MMKKKNYSAPQIKLLCMDKGLPIMAASDYSEVTIDGMEDGGNLSKLFIFWATTE